MEELTCYFAAQWGHVDCLKYAHEHGCKWDQIVNIRQPFSCANIRHSNIPFSAAAMHVPSQVQPF